MARIVVPDDSPPVLTGSAAEARLRELGEVEIFPSDCEGAEELLGHRPVPRRCRPGHVEDGSIRRGVSGIAR